MLLLVACASPAWSSGDDDLLGEYIKDIKGEAKAKVEEYQNAYAKNMAYHIKRNAVDGLVVDSSIPQINDLYISDGFGNVSIQDGANVGTVINEFIMNNVNMIIQGNQRVRY